MRRLLLVLVLALSSAAHAAVIVATSLSQADVQAAIDAAVDGDTVILPADSVIWTSSAGIVITAKQITIQGAGIGQTVIEDRCNATSVFIFQNYHLSGGKTFTITGIEINHHATLYSDAAITTGFAPNCLIGGMKITEIAVRGIYVASPQGNYPLANAVIYDSELYGRASNGVSQLITVFGNDYEAPPLVASTTQSSWYLPAGMGGSLATFVENCILYNSHYQDSTIETYNGGRCVVRYCTLTNFLIGAHGNDSSTRSGHTIEVYNNTITDTIGWSNVNLRGGVGYWFNNITTSTWPSPGSPMTLQVYRLAGFNLTNGNPFLLTLRTAAGNFVVGRSYSISTVGTTDWMAIGAASNTANVVFTATGVGSGTGTASNRLYVGLYDYNTSNDRYERSAEVGSGDGSRMGIVTGFEYRITFAGTTNWVAIGAASNTVGTVFTATGAGSGTGLAVCTTMYFEYTSNEWRLYGEGLHQLTHPDATTRMREMVVTSPNGAYAASGFGDIVVSSGGVLAINALNGAYGVDGNTTVPDGTGTHTGGSGEAVLTDGTKSWSTNELLGDGSAAYNDELFSYYIWNLTSGAGAFVTANDGTTVTAPLSGGDRQTWSTGDSYVITMGYPGLDMVGRGGPTRFYDKSGVTTSNAINVRYSTQALVPCYVWDNVFNGAPDTRDVVVSWEGDYDTTNSPFISSFVQEGREYYNNAGAPPGYTPYTYPHPLRPEEGTQANITTLNVTTLTVGAP